ncbi:MAG: hypothetical protein U0990_04665 [Candidatus Nanopelagicales bacterium]|nr:hypothetical protein [Candidatus Nanopelagicales bacterium]MDZ4249365.1 hypothetical protein [Candidatus Nanopelagicales bacterium]
MRFFSPRDERGVGLILVVGMTAMVLVLVASALILAQSALERSRHRSDFELSLATAEDGIDTTLARLQVTYDNDNEDFPIPGTQSGTTCSLTQVEQESFDTEAAENTWARAEIAALEEQGCIQTTDTGQYVVFKPASAASSLGRVYSLGWSPSIDSPTAVSRLVKVEYQFLPYSPTLAVLTQGNLEIDSSATVTTAGGADPSLAGAHANGQITTTGNPIVEGLVTSTGSSTATSNNFNSNPGGTVPQAPRVTVPRISALSFYKHARDLDPDATAEGSWYDLCPDGSVRPYSVNGPCDAATSTYSGAWVPEFDADDHMWTISSNARSGTYFAFEADVEPGVGNGSFDNLTVVASAANPNNCATKTYGNITWDHYDIDSAAFTNTFMFADSDLLITSNFTAGSSTGTGADSGMLVAGDQIELETSSNVVVGAVVAADQCDTSDLVDSNVIKNVTIRFAPTAKSPFASIINQNLWLEFPGAG